MFEEFVKNISAIYKSVRGATVYGGAQPGMVMNFTSVVGGPVQMLKDLVTEAMWATRVRLSLVAGNYLVNHFKESINKPQVLNFRAADQLAYIRFERRGPIELRTLYYDGAGACLLLAGCFPEVACRRRVPVSFYVGCGQRFFLEAAAFEFEGGVHSSKQLAREFTSMVSILRSVRYQADERRNLWPVRTMSDLYDDFLPN